MPPPKPLLSTLQKIPLPSPLTIGTDICHIPRIHRILTASARPGVGAQFARRLMGEEELAANSYAFAAVFGRFDALLRSRRIARAFRRKGRLGLAGLGVGGIDGKGEGEGLGKSVLGEEAWRLILPRGHERWKSRDGGAGIKKKPQAEQEVSREGVVIGVLRSVINWKRYHKEEGLGTPWEVLIESVRKGRDAVGVGSDVINAMRVLTGKGVGGEVEIDLDELEDLEGVKGLGGDILGDGSTRGDQFRNQVEDMTMVQPETPTSESTHSIEDRAENKLLAEELITSLEVPEENYTSFPSGIQNDVKLFLAVESSLQNQLTEIQTPLQKAAIFLAGRFAAKEAIIKAHHSRRLTYHDIMIIPQPPNEQGSRPPLGYVVGNGLAKEVSFSISHDAEYATATAMVYDSDTYHIIRKVASQSRMAVPEPEPEVVKEFEGITKVDSGGFPGSKVNFLW